MSPKYTDVIVDPGHGGLVDGQYVTPGKRYTFTHDEHGEVLPTPLVHYEGPWVRVGAAHMALMFLGMGVRVHVTTLLSELTDFPAASYPGDSMGRDDVSLRKRVEFANQVHAEAKARGGAALFVSRHSNAIGNESIGTGRSARGISIYTSPGETASDAIATSILESYSEGCVGMPIRRGDWSDGDVDHEAAFYVLRKTHCPAVLVEAGFHTNIHDVRVLQTTNGQMHLAICEVLGLLPYLVLPI